MFNVANMQNSLNGEEKAMSALPDYIDQVSASILIKQAAV